MKDNDIICARGSGKSSYQLIKHIRAEVIKEFAERLKRESRLFGCDTYLVFEFSLDNLVKEMTEVSENA